MCISGRLGRSGRNMQHVVLTIKIRFSFKWMKIIRRVQTIGFMQIPAFETIFNLKLLGHLVKPVDLLLLTTDCSVLNCYRKSNSSLSSSPEDVTPPSLTPFIFSLSLRFSLCESCAALQALSSPLVVAFLLQETSSLFVCSSIHSFDCWMATWQNVRWLFLCRFVNSSSSFAKLYSFSQLHLKQKASVI